MKFNKAKVRGLLTILEESSQFVDRVVEHPDYIATAALCMYYAGRDDSLKSLEFNDWLGFIALITNVVPKSATFRSVEFLPNNVIATFIDNTVVEVLTFFNKDGKLSRVDVRKTDKGLGKIVLSGKALAEALTIVEGLCKKLDAIEDDEEAMNLADKSIETLLKSSFVCSNDVTRVLTHASDWDKLVGVYRYVADNKGSVKDVSEVDLTTDSIMFRYKNDIKYLDMCCSHCSCTDAN